MRRRAYHAYLARSARIRPDRRAGAVRHAVSHEAALAGLAEPDAMCGQLVAVDEGPWDSNDPRACWKCRLAVDGPAETDREAG